MSPKRGAYPREFREDAIRKLRAGRQPAELARELGVTPGTLRVWLHVAEDGSMDGRARDDVIARTVQAYERMTRALKGLPSSSLDTPMPFASEAIDPWLVKDAIAHVAHYKARAVHRLMDSADVAVPRRLKEKLDAYWDQTAWTKLESSDHVIAAMDARTRRRHGRNHLVYERWRSRSGREILDWYDLVHKYVVAALADGPEVWFSADGRRSSLSREAAAALSVHSDQHLRDIGKALGASP